MASPNPDVEYSKALKSLGINLSKYQKKCKQLLIDLHTVLSRSYKKDFLISKSRGVKLGKVWIRKTERATDAKKGMVESTEVALDTLEVNVNSIVECIRCYFQNNNAASLVSRGVIWSMSDEYNTKIGNLLHYCIGKNFSHRMAHGEARADLISEVQQTYDQLHRNVSSNTAKIYVERSIRYFGFLHEVGLDYIFKKHPSRDVIIKAQKTELKNIIIECRGGNSTTFEEVLQRLPVDCFIRIYMDSEEHTNLAGGGYEETSQVEYSNEETTEDDSATSSVENTVKNQQCNHPSWDIEMMEHTSMQPFKVYNLRSGKK